MTRDKIRVGIIGAGDAASYHIPGYLLAAEHAQVTAIADVDAQRAQRCADRLGSPRVFADYREMIASSLVDAVDICLPHHLHKNAVVVAAAAGKHILCEKPLCLNLEEAATVTAAVAGAGITMMCAHNQLFLPAVAAARKAIRDGRLGKVFTARTTDIFALSADEHSMGWRTRRATNGGGELIDTGYHPAYLLLYLVDSSPVRVTAILSRHRLTFMEGEDSAHVLVEFADGSVGTISTSWAYEAPACTERFSVAGEAGSLWSDGASVFIKSRGAEQVVLQEPIAAQSDSYALEVVDYIACLREGRRPVHNETDGVEVLKVILGAYASVEQKAIVELRNL